MPVEYVDIKTAEVYSRDDIKKFEYKIVKKLTQLKNGYVYTINLITIKSFKLF